jgi:succinate dehydrogenase/fumarate reductase-like Fe-S protein
MIQNFSVMENLELSEQEKTDLEEARQFAGLYCDGCSQCLLQCKKHLPVNEYMRAFMYTYGYRQFESAHAVLDDLGGHTNPCDGCHECTVNCPKGFRVDKRIADVSKLSAVPREMIV